jgi:hypothetical protein
MFIDKKDKTIFNFRTRKWLKLIEVYLPDGCENDGRICCLKTNEILGYTWDKEWIWLHK